MNKQRVRTVLKYILFLMYIALLVYVVLFAEMFGRTTISEYYRYNLVPFREIMRFVTHSRYLGLTVVLLNVLGNVIAFVLPFIIFMWTRKQPELCRTCIFRKPCTE